LRKVPPRTPLQKLSNDMESQSWVQIWNTKPAMQLTKFILLKVCTYYAISNSMKFFEMGLGLTS